MTAPVGDAGGKAGAASAAGAVGATSAAAAATAASAASAADSAGAAGACGTPPDLLSVVRAAVAGRRPVDGREARSRHRMLVALGRLERPFDKDADPTHVTGSAVVLGPRGVLLHRHKRLGIWLQPGGHLEPGETPWDAARREAHEETGLFLRFSQPCGQTTGPPLLHLDVHDGGRGHTHLDLRYLFDVTGDDCPDPQPGESQEVRWFSWEEAFSVVDPGLSGLLRICRPQSQAPAPA
jgi:8-oxo-dGTP pyrophosphatase MutT (NUDIX family)